MSNDPSTIISRFHLSSMLIVLLMILGMGVGVLYSLLAGQQVIDNQTGGIVLTAVFVLWAIVNRKDWWAYFKLYQQNKQIVHDERFEHHNHRVAKVSFVALIASNFSLLLIDLALYSLSASFVAVFSLVFGLSVFLLTLVVLELRA